MKITAIGTGYVGLGCGAYVTDVGSIVPCLDETKVTRLQAGSTRIHEPRARPGEDGSADMQHVLASARSVGRHMDAPSLVVDKSTGPVGTGGKVPRAFASGLAARGESIGVHVGCNPEVLKEGEAIDLSCGRTASSSQPTARRRSR